MKSKQNNKLNHSEQQVAKDLDFIAAVLNTIDALVLVLDAKGSIVLFNRLCERVTGYSFDEVKGKYVWDFLLTKEEVAPVKEVFSKLKAGMFPNSFTNYWVAKNGRNNLISWTNTAILDNAGEVEYIVPTGIDITEKTKAEEELKKRMEDLEKFYEMSVHRELKMKSLKKEIVKLKSDLSRYS